MCVDRYIEEIRARWICGFGYSHMYLRLYIFWLTNFHQAIRVWKRSERGCVEITRLDNTSLKRFLSISFIIYLNIKSRHVLRWIYQTCIRTCTLFLHNANHITSLRGTKNDVNFDFPFHWKCEACKCILKFSFLSKCFHDNKIVDFIKYCFKELEFFVIRVSCLYGCIIRISQLLEK